MMKMLSNILFGFHFRSSSPCPVDLPSAVDPPTKQAYSRHLKTYEHDQNSSKYSNHDFFLKKNRKLPSVLLFFVPVLPMNLVFSGDFWNGLLSLHGGHRFVFLGCRPLPTSMKTMGSWDGLRDLLALALQPTWRALTRVEGPKKYEEMPCWSTLKWWSIEAIARPFWKISQDPVRQFT